ncbi:hypothetical protein FISHEDRAFT_36049, partial [Fistulina hepatica ATCC 64428]
SSALVTVGMDAFRTEKQKFKACLAAAQDSDDPLAAYDDFVRWTMEKYAKDDPNSGLRELLEEAVQSFKKDNIYKTDIRYFRLCVLYAHQLDAVPAIKFYDSLLTANIATCFAGLYQEYGDVLEKHGRHAEAVYRKGIRRQTRGAERLKARYKEFRTKYAGNAKSNAARSTSKSSPDRPPQPAPPASTTSQRPRRSHDRRSSHPPSGTVPVRSTAAERYAVMLAPPASGKRPEEFCFDFSLLYTPEGGEFSIQEARARSMGLLNKRWGPPSNELTHAEWLDESTGATSAYMFSSASPRSAPVNPNDNDLRARPTHLRVPPIGAEPTVTINTKEALADVFGMYNSPEKTTRIAQGSKHAPLDKVDTIVPYMASKPQPKPVMNGFQVFVDESSAVPTPSVPASFRPFVDEPSSRSENAFQDHTRSVSAGEQHSNENPTSRPHSRAASNNENRALRPKTPLEGKKLPLTKDESDSLSPQTPQGAVFTSNVFTPLPLREAHTDDHGQPLQRPKGPLHERARSYHDGDRQDGEKAVPLFKPLLDEADMQTPFRVFSRPPTPTSAVPAFRPFRDETPTAPASAFIPFRDEQPKSAPPAPTFTPFRDGPSSEPVPTPTFTPFRDALPRSAFTPFKDEPAQDPEPPRSTRSDEEAPSVEVAAMDDYSGDFQDDVEVEVPDDDEGVDEDLYVDGYAYGNEQYNRCGAVTVMTPITERTLEFSMSRSMEGNGVDGDGLDRVTETEEHSMLDELCIKNIRSATDNLHLSDLDHDEQTPQDTRTHKLVASLLQSFRPPNPCNPFDPPIVRDLLAQVHSDPYFYDLSAQTSGHFDGLQRYAKAQRKSGGGADVAGLYALSLEGQRFTVLAKLGEGGFGAVFKAQDRGMQIEGMDDDEDDDFDFDMDEENASMVALKVVRPRNLWEYHVLRRMHSAAPPAICRSIVAPRALYAFGDESFLVLDLLPHGTLLDLVNRASDAGISQNGACLDELLVFFYTIELLRLIEALHRVGFIHGDLKIDNCLLRIEDVPGGATAWTSVYSPSGSGGWACKGLKLIDFGRTIDTRLFPEGQRFVAEWETDDRDAPEIREGTPWTYETDYHGLASIVYCMFFGKYMQTSVTTTESGRRRIATSMKRYWQKEIWDRVFDILLNPKLIRPDGELPLCDEIRDLRENMEMWLQANCNRTGGTLKGLLKKVELSCL